MENDALLRLDNQLCFVLYACSRGLTKTYRPLLAKLDITYPQYLVMLILWEKDGVSIKALGEKLYLDSGTLTPLLKRLETAGLVERRRSSTDERVVQIYLAQKGVDLKKKAYAVPETLLCRSGLTVDQFIGLKTELTALLERIRAFDAATSSCLPEQE